jgi:hypothetical protein
MEISRKLAYAAGLVDGEGSINIGHTDGTGSFELSLAVGMQDSRAVSYLAGILPGSHSPQKDGKTHRYAVTATKAAEALRRLLPYLSSKQRQANLAIEYVKLGIRPGTRSYPEWLFKAKLEMHERMKQLHLPNLEDMEDLPSLRDNHAYCAGLVDGEGWIGFGKSGRGYSSMLTIEMTDLAPVARFARTFGGVFAPQKRRTKRGKLVYRCRIERVKAREACRLMLPYFKVKRPQAELLIRYVNNVALWLKRLGRGNEKRTPENVIEKRRQWRKKMLALNRCAGAETKSEQPRNEVSDSPNYENGKLAECNRNDCIVIPTERIA